MLKKLNLDGTKEYEVAVAASHVSQMLVAYSQGHEHILSIGAEQGEVAKWDDLVLKEKTGERHIQIKRQNTDFNLDPCVRNKYTRKKRKGQLKDLSPFDEAIKSLGEWVSVNDPSTTDKKKTFEVYLPEGTVHIKSEIQVNVLKHLCENHIKDVTTAQGLNNLQAIDANINHCYDWLTTWCGFKDWEHILKALRLLEIVAGGSKVDIDSNTINNLQNIFHSPSEVLIKIKGFICDNTTFTGAITPRHLLKLVRSNLQPEVLPWTQFEQTGMDWEISGTIDTELDHDFERPSVLVPILWDTTNKGNLKLVVPRHVESLLLN